MLRLCLFAALLFLTACEPSIAPAPIPTLAPTAEFDTAWGDAHSVTVARTFDPPALTVDDGATLLAAFETVGNLPTLALYRDGARSLSNVTANRPFGLTVFQSADSGALAMWLDDDGSGTQKLYSVRLEQDGTSLFGATSVSSGAVTRYAAAALPDGGYWVVWTTPITGESALIGSRIDPAGRPRSPQPLRIDADFPALAVTNSGNVYLYWLDSPRRNLYGAELTDSGMTRITEIASAAVTLNPADQLLRFDAAFDQTHVYLFWQIRQASGATAVWYLSTPISGGSGAIARQLRVTSGENPAQTGFNHGVAFEARFDESGQPVSWAQPAAGQNETLPVAVVLDGHLGAIYFQDGLLAAQQIIAAIQSPLIAPPRIAADSERDLILAWWQPQSSASAILYAVESP